MINFFNFKKFNGEFLLTNDLGRYIFLKPKEFHELLSVYKTSDITVNNRLAKNAFTFDSSLEAFIDKNWNHMRNSKNFVFQATQLHIFVVTTACNLQCVYCQAQNGNSIPHGFMNKEIAKKAVDLALQSPAVNLQFEFQGGEPLMNFDIIRFIVTYSQANKGNKNIRYSVVTNLTLLTENILEFLNQYQIEISTSLDGDACIHNMNRPYKNGGNTIEKVEAEIRKVKASGNISIGAIQTTTRASLSRPREIVDEYIKMGFSSISLRALTPLGVAKKQWDTVGYQPQEFLDFYKRAFDYILEINLQGRYLSEGIASVMLKKIIEGVSMNYMELRSPCGASMGQIAYYYDGNVYTCDEGRMIAEMGNDAFRLGNVESSYYELMDTKTCKAICSASILESLPSCSDCVYQPYCGVCPAVNYALDGDVYEKTPKNYRCRIYGGILDIIFNKLQEDDYAVRQIFRSWIQ